MFAQDAGCDAAAERLAQQYEGEYVCVPAHVANLGGIDSFVADLRERTDHVDVLVNNVGAP